ncbi:MAG: ATP-binding cassette domain-containing protein [Candidatus Ancillula sp.]|jgi:ABC-2 type transport system ATP-binding protein|nr:ATP-binding cassette domain-containing protein [Candidatus Ancillula sp.]
MIRVENLTKRFGSKLAVNDISFELAPGRVTGFLGPNGSGKSTTMRMILGLDTPTSGVALIDGKPYSRLENPALTVGAMIDSKAFHKARNPFNHLLALAKSARIDKQRVNEVLKITGLESVAHKNAGGFSLGMAQRIGIAVALLGNPKILILDEPVNGLDPEGVIWVRDLCKKHAANGGSVFISSHLLSEIQQTADDLIILGKGSILKSGSMKSIIDSASKKSILVNSSDNNKLASILVSRGLNAKLDQNSSKILVSDCSPEAIGDIALSESIAIYAIEQDRQSLENIFTQLTHESVEYRSGSGGQNGN